MNVPFAALVFINRTQPQNTQKAHSHNKSWIEKRLLICYPFYMEKNGEKPEKNQRDQTQDRPLKRASGQSDNPTTKNEPIVHSISVDGASKHQDMTMKNAAVVFVLVILAGVASGYAFSYMSSSKATTSASGENVETLSNGKDVVESAGIADKDTFKDSAEGKLADKEKDDPNEGSYKLIRPGGESQTVFLTSSTVDLSEFIGKEVRVYGETFDSEKVGWLMDVGFIEIKK